MKTQITSLFLFFVFIGFSQEKEVHVKFIYDPITIDGVLDESVWQKAKPATDFWQMYPVDSIKSERNTELYFLYNDKNLYVGMKVYAAGNDFIIPSLRRDFRARGNDNITLMFDTFNDATNAYMFGTNPHGVQREAQISGGGSDISGFNSTWDTKWVGETSIHSDHYVAEWMIPLSAFKYRQGEKKWRFNCYQFDTQDNTRSTWINIPQNQMIISLAYMGDLIFEKPLGKSSSPISIIPYINALSGKDFESGDKTNDFKVGGDAKLTIGNSMNLDLTINPDFSQVEVDRQVTNLTRYEISLPERRQFFIENSDLFADYGDSRDARPFFSRRIGIAQDLDGNSIENSIIGGVRLSGKLTNNLRLGVLNMQTEEDLKNEIPTTNNAVITLQQKVFNRSNLSFLFINKQATKDYDFLDENDTYNRVIGLDYKLASKDNSWVGNYYFHKSFSPNTSSKDFSAGISTSYNSKNFEIRLSGLYVGDHFRSDLGFIKRTGILKMNPSISRTFYPNNRKIQSHSFSVTPIVLWRPEINYENSDYTIMSSWRAQFQNTAEIEVEFNNNFTHLYESFEPTGTDNALALPGNKNYYYNTIELSYNSDLRKKITYRISPSYGGFFNGTKFSMESSLGLRIQPRFTSSIQVNYDSVDLPTPYSNANIWLIGPRFDLTFNKKMFWATFIQYSNQRDNFSVNTRFQWRFAPLSDLFLVYNDNYFTDGTFSPRVRSINLKMTYWLNI